MGSILVYILQYVITAAIIVAVSETAKRSDRLGGFLAALPLVTILTLIWLEVDNQPEDLIRLHALYTLIYVFPTLPMFLAFPYFYDRMDFNYALLSSCATTIFCFLLEALVLYPLGIDILFDSSTVWTPLLSWIFFPTKKRTSECMPIEEVTTFLGGNKKRKINVFEV